MGSFFSKTAVAPLDPRLTESTKLLPNELALLQQGPSPIGTLTWVEGDLQVDVLKERLAQLAAANPWITGCITKDGHLNYPLKAEEDLVKPLFVKLESIDDNIHHEETDFTKLSCLLTKNGALLRPKKDTEQPLMRVCVVKSSRSSNIFGIVVSMSHVAVDGHTYYQLYNALMNNDSDNMPKIDPQRLQESNQLKEQAIGKQNLVFMRPGMLVSLLGGLLYDAVMYPFQKQQLKIEKIIAMIDSNKMRELKSSVHAKDCKYISTNDVVTSWFLSQSKANYGFMALNLRNRLKGHTAEMGGNYSDLLYYRTPTDTQDSTMIRKSIKDLRRTESHHQEPSFLELASGKTSFVTNWASLASGTVILPGMKLLAHYPMVDLGSNAMPSTMAFCVIFRAKADQLGILFAGASYRMKGLLEECPFVVDSAKSKIAQ